MPSPGLAEMTGAEWAHGLAGCAAGMAHTTAACVTGGNPDLHVRIPDLTGFAKDEVVIPKARATSTTRPSAPSASNHRGRRRRGI